MKRIKLTHIITSLGSGGAESMLCKLLENIDREKFDVQVISLLDEGVYGEKIEKEFGIPVYTLNLKWYSIFKSIFKCLRLCKSTNIIHGWMYHANIFSFIIGKILRKKVVWGLHHSDLSEKNNKKLTLLIIKFSSKISHYIDSVISCGEVVKNVHLNIGYYSKNNIVIPNGFDTNKFNMIKSTDFHKKLGIRKNKKIILHVARWHPTKDYENLLKSISLLKKMRDDFVLIMVGSKIDYNNDELLNLISYYNLRESTILLGKRDDIQDLMAFADFFVSSSSGEGFPNVIGEAMASGAYCIVTNAGDSGNIVGEYGEVVPIKNSVELADAINKSMNMEKNLYYAKILKARERVILNYDIKNVKKKYEELYIKLLK